jgi:hypothetical protein
VIDRRCEPLRPHFRVRQNIPIRGPYHGRFDGVSEHAYLHWALGFRTPPHGHPSKKAKLFVKGIRSETPARAAVIVAALRRATESISLWTAWSTEVSLSSWWYFGGASMATIERNSDGSDPVHDFAWHQTHRPRRGWQSIDIVMLAGWAGLVGWVVMRQ